MNIRVYNAEQIGGCFTVIETKQSRIMIDYGMVLPGTKKKQEEYDWESNPVDAVFFTHYHGDHIGRIAELTGKKMPLYMGGAAREVMLNIHEALSSVSEDAHHQQLIELLNDSGRIKLLEENQAIKVERAEHAEEEKMEGLPTVKFPTLRVIPYSVDHSAYDAYMFLIEEIDENGEVTERALHTGDFRDHGYRGGKLSDMVRKHILRSGKPDERSIDYLIVEGTMLNERKKDRVMTEAELEKEAKKLLKENKYVFLKISSTNLDSLASFYWAACTNGRPVYCYSPYIKKQLATFTKWAGARSKHYRFANVEVLELKRGCLSEQQRVKMQKSGFLCIIQANEYYTAAVKPFLEEPEQVKMVYSMWMGYLNRQHPSKNEKWIKFFEKYQAGNQFVTMHTSGHAVPDAVAALIEETAPKKEIIPMHTENKRGFLELEIAEEYKKILRGIGLTDAEREQINSPKEKKKDRRAIRDQKLKEAFLNGGLKVFREYVQEYNTKAKKEDRLAVLFRGNASPQKISIYYRNHVLWDLCINKKGNPTVRFNFDHARYLPYEEWNKIRQWLTRPELGFTIYEKPWIKAQTNTATIGTCISANRESFSDLGEKRVTEALGLEFIQEKELRDIEVLHRMFKRIMDEFFKPVGTDYYLKSVSNALQAEEKRKSDLIEKRWQQRLLVEFNEQFCAQTAWEEFSGLYVYDLEFSQRFPSMAIRKKLSDRMNKPDMLAVRFEKGRAVGLVLIEVKCTESVCEGNSGIEAHVTKMYDYCINSDFEPFLENRKEDMGLIFEQYKEFGFLPEAVCLDKLFDDFREGRIKTERILLLTNSELPVEEKMLCADKTTKSALRYYKENKSEVDVLCREKDCHILCLSENSNYFDDSLYCLKAGEAVDIPENRCALADYFKR